jgi:Rrf2 family nitric oxide-sensitive transcriptional repressor
MLTKTTVTAVRTLIHLGLHAGGGSLPIRRIAERLGESPTYLAKVARCLVKAGILKARHGVMGGIRLHRPPKSITLLAITEACQGAILAEFCQETRTLDGVCAFHEAAAELHKAVVRSLSRWTLEQLLDRPAPSGHAAAGIPCLLQPPASESQDPAYSRPPRRPGKTKRDSTQRRQERIGR